MKLNFLMLSSFHHLSKQTMTQASKQRLHSMKAWATFSGAILCAAFRGLVAKTVLSSGENSQKSHFDDASKQATFAIAFPPATRCYQRHWQPWCYWQLHSHCPLVTTSSTWRCHAGGLITSNLWHCRLSFSVIFWLLVLPGDAAFGRGSR